MKMFHSSVGLHLVSSLYPSYVHPLIHVGVITMQPLLAIGYWYPRLGMVHELLAMICLGLLLGWKRHNR